MLVDHIRIFFEFSQLNNNTFPFRSSTMMPRGPAFARMDRAFHLFEFNGDTYRRLENASEEVIATALEQLGIENEYWPNSE